jgi:Flp pilus assembly protein TadB
MAIFQGKRAQGRISSNTQIKKNRKNRQKYTHTRTKTKTRADDLFQCASFRSYRLSLDIISQEKEEEEEEEGGVAEKSIAGGLVESMANNKILYFLFFLVFVLVFSTANSYIVAGIVYLTSSA